MPTIQDLRGQFPELSSIPDSRVPDYIHRNYYSDLPKADVYKALGMDYTDPNAEAAPVDNQKDDGSSVLRRYIADPALSLTKGAIGMVEGGVGLADMAAGGRVGKFLENDGGSVGFRPKQAKEYADSLMSPEQQAANKQVQDATGVVDTAKAALSNPSTIAHAALESAPSMLPGAGIARGLGAAAGVGPIVGSAIGEGVVGAGQAASDIRSETADGLLTGKQVGHAALSGAGTGLLGAAGGKMAKSLGIGDVDTLLAGQVTDASQKGFVRKAIEGAVSEGVLEELPQSVQEQVNKNAALGRPLDEGVDKAAVMGTLTGGVMGGGAANFTGSSPQARADAQGAAPDPFIEPELPAGEQPSPMQPPQNLALPAPETPQPGQDPIFVDQQGGASFEQSQPEVPGVQRVGDELRYPSPPSDIQEVSDVTPGRAPTESSIEARKRIEARLDEAGSEYGIGPDVLAKIKEASAVVPRHQLTEFHKRAVENLQKYGLMQGQVDDALYKILDGHMDPPQEAPKQAAKKPAPQLTYEGNRQSGVMRATADGAVFPESQGQRVEANNELARLQAENAALRQHMESIGLTPDVQRAQQQRFNPQDAGTDSGIVGQQPSDMGAMPGDASLFQRPAGRASDGGSAGRAVDGLGGGGPTQYTGPRNVSEALNEADQQAPIEAGFAAPEVGASAESVPGSSTSDLEAPRVDAQAQVYNGRTGRGMSRKGAETQLAEVSKSRPDASWSVEPAPDLGEGKFRLIGQPRSDATSERFDGQAGQGMTRLGAESQLPRVAMGKPHLNWSVQKASDLPGKDRYRLVGEPRQFSNESATIDEKMASFGVPEGVAFSRIDDGENDAADTNDSGAASDRDLEVFHRAIGNGADSVRPFESRDLPEHEGLRQIAGAIGQRFKSFAIRDSLLASDRKKFGGIGGAFTNGTIYIRANQPNSHLALLGHEVAHQLRKDRPDLYDELVEAVRPYVDQKRYADEFTKSAIARNETTEDAIREEFTAEVLADGFMDKGFWQAVADKRPGLLGSVLDVIRDTIDKIKSRINPSRKTEKYLADFDKVMQIAGGVFAEYTADKVAPGNASSGVKFSRFDEAVKSVSDARLPAGYMLGDLIKSAPGKVGWWHKTVGTMHDLAERSPQFKKVYDGVQTFLGDVSQYANAAADMAPTIIPKVETLADLKKSPVAPADVKAYSRAVFAGTLKWTRDESGKLMRMEDKRKQTDKLSTKEKGDELLRRGFVNESRLKEWRGMKLDSHDKAVNDAYEQHILDEGVVFSDQELKDLWELTPRQIKLYREFRSATDKSLNDMAVSEMLRIAGKDASGVKDQALSAKTADDAASILRDHLFKLGEQNIDRKDQLDANGNAMIDVADKVNSLTRRGYAPLMRFGQYTIDITDKSGERQYFGMFETQREANKMARELAAQFPGSTIQRGTVSQEEYKMFAGVNPETAELFGEMLGLDSQGSGESAQAFQEYLRRAKSTRSAMKRMIQRKGISGFSEDAGRVLAGFVYSNARKTSSNLNDQAITQSILDMPKQNGELKDTAVRLVDSIRNPNEAGSKIKGFMFAQYIGGSIASAMVNATGVLTVSYPYLSQYGGIANAGKQMAQGLKDALRKTTGDKALDAALKHAEDIGVVAPQEIHHLMSQAQGMASLRSGDGTRAGDALAAAQNGITRTMMLWGKPFSVVEQFNRRATFIAAFRTAQEQGMKDPAAFASKAVTDTQFTYNKGNRPEWARSAAGSALFTFKTYSVSYIELMNRMYKSGPEGKKAALLGLAILFLMSGADGLPFVKDIEDLIDGIMQRLGYNFSSNQKKREFFASVLGDDLGNAAMKGVTGLPGMPIDLSGRMGLGNMIPGTGLLTKKADHTDDVLEIGGPVAGFAKRVFQAGDQAASGDVGESIKTIAPLAASNAMKGLDMATTGMYRDMKGRKVIDTSLGEAIGKGLGFQPESVARVQDATGKMQGMIARAKDEESKITQMWAEGMVLDDQDQIEEARERLKKWNERNPDSPIRVKPDQIKRKVQTMRMSKSDRIAKTAPKELRKTVRQELSQP